jgi:DnaJ-domain-containing protein 1
MLTKMLMEIFQAIIEDPTIRKMLGNYDLNKNKDKDIEQMMDELGLNAEQRVKFRAAYKDYQSDPNQSYEKYKYKYEPKSDSPFDKFDAYFNKFEDYAKETGDYRHREYEKYRNQSNSNTNNNQKKSSFVSDEEKKHLQSLELKEGATFDQIKAAYKTQMKKYHPDKFSDATQKKYAESLSQRINQAYDYFKKKFDQK